MESSLLYYRVKEDIIDKINNGILKLGQALPSEKKMCEEYGVSRVTIRHAIEELIKEQILVREFGKTALVNQRIIPRNANTISGLTEAMARLGITVSSFVLSVDIVDNSDPVYNKMNIDTDKTILQIERLRYANGRVLGYSVFYIMEDLCKGIDTSKLVNTSIYEVLEKDFGISIVYAKQEVSAVIADYRLTMLLKLKENTPMLKVVRLGYDNNKRCIEYSENFYIGEKYKLDMELYK